MLRFSHEHIKKSKAAALATFINILPPEHLPGAKMASIKPFNPGFGFTPGWLVQSPGPTWPGPSFAVLDLLIGPNTFSKELLSHQAPLHEPNELFLAA